VEKHKRIITQGRRFVLNLVGPKEVQDKLLSMWRFETQYTEGEGGNRLDRRLETKFIREPKLLNDWVLKLEAKTMKTNTCGYSTTKLRRKLPKLEGTSMEGDSVVTFNDWCFSQGTDPSPTEKSIKYKIFPPLEIGKILQQWDLEVGTRVEWYRKYATYQQGILVGKDIGGGRCNVEFDIKKPYSDDEYEKHYEWVPTTNIRILPKPDEEAGKPEDEDREKGYNTDKEKYREELRKLVK